MYIIYISDDIWWLWSNLFSKKTVRSLEEARRQAGGAPDRVPIILLADGPELCSSQQRHASRVYTLSLCGRHHIAFQGHGLSGQSQCWQGKVFLKKMGQFWHDHKCHTGSVSKDCLNIVMKCIFQSFPMTKVYDNEFAVVIIKDERSAQLVVTCWRPGGTWSDQPVLLITALAWTARPDQVPCTGRGRICCARIYLSSFFCGGPQELYRRSGDSPMAWRSWDSRCHSSSTDFMCLA